MGRTINVGQEAYKGGDIKPIPAGTKLLASVFAIEEVPVKNGANAGKSQLDVTFKVQEPGEYFGREIRYQKIPLYDGTSAWKLVAFADALGWATKPQVELPDDLSSVQGNTLTIKVSEEKPNQRGQVFNGVSGFAGASAAQASSVPAAEAAPSWGTLNKS